jgi:hypothetical protein
MARVIAGLTTSFDGYITGPNDGPGKGSARAASEALAAGLVDELSIVIAPLILG